MTMRITADGPAHRTPTTTEKERGARTSKHALHCVLAAILPRLDYAAFLASGLTSTTLLAERTGRRVAALRMFVGCLPNAV